MFPQLEVNLQKIKENAALILQHCRSAGIDPCAVTKVVCGDSAVVNALVEAGFTQLADSRLENISKIRMSLGNSVETLLLRLPALSHAREVVRCCNLSLNSEVSVLAELNARAGELGLTHRVILMVDLGDLREGIWGDELRSVGQRTRKMRHIEVVGLGANLTCYGGVVPTPENLSKLIELKQDWELSGYGQLKLLSGGNSSSLYLVLDGRIPAGINHLRIGEGIFLGRETAYGRPLPGTHDDAFILKAEVIELKEKPSVPVGQVNRDAFGNIPVIEERGIHRRAVLAIGKQDTDFSLRPLNPDLNILGGSSDHLLLDAADAPQLKVGDIVEFIPSYGALLAAMTSPYVQKSYIP